MLSGGYDVDFVQNTPYGAGASEEAKAAAEAAKADIKAKKPVYAGPLKDNTGKEVIAAGAAHAPYDPWIDGINFLVEGVVGSIT
jgi:simple sugar transport system substrate-binding protein